MKDHERSAAVLVLFEGLFISVYVCAAKFAFQGSGTLFSTSLMMLLVSLSLAAASFPYRHFERQAAVNKGQEGAACGMGRAGAWDWCCFSLWSLFAIGGDILLFFAVTYNAPLAESSLLTRGAVIALLALGSRCFFSQKATRKQWLGIVMGLAATAGTAVLVLASKGGLLTASYEYWWLLPVWVYFVPGLVVSNPGKLLAARFLLSRFSVSACMRTMNGLSIPLCLMLMGIAAAFQHSPIGGVSPRFWWALPVMLGAVLLGVPARYAAQRFGINPVYHDGLRYGIMLAVQFSYDLTAMLASGRSPSPSLLAVLLAAMLLSLGSSYILYRASAGSTSKG